MIRFLRWCLGLDPLDLLRDQYELAHREAAALEEQANTLSGRLQSEFRANREVLRTTEHRYMQMKGEMAELVTKLNQEEAIRNLYEQVVIEAGQQIIKNSEVAPKTMLGILKGALVEAVATAEEWRRTGNVDTGEITNARAKLASQLLPDPDRSRDRGGMTTERKRDGRVGDTTTRVKPDQPHLYQYPFDGKDIYCAVRGCGRTLTDVIHEPSHPKWAAAAEADFMETRRRIWAATGEVVGDTHPYEYNPSTGTCGHCGQGLLQGDHQ